MSMKRERVETVASRVARPSDETLNVGRRRLLIGGAAALAGAVFVVSVPDRGYALRRFHIPTRPLRSEDLEMNEGLAG